MSQHGRHRRPSWLAQFKANRQAKRQRQLIKVRHDRMTRKLAEMRQIVENAH